MGLGRPNRAIPSGSERVPDLKENKKSMSWGQNDWGCGWVKKFGNVDWSRGKDQERTPHGGLLAGFQFCQGRGRGRNNKRHQSESGKFQPNRDHIGGGGTSFPPH